MMKRTKLKFTALALAAGVALAGCTGPGDTDADEADTEGAAIDFKLSSPGTITMAMGISPPRVTAEGDKVGGIEGEILNRVAEKYGITVTPFVTSFAGKLEAVKTGRADVGTATFYTDDRAEIYFFAKPDSLDPSFVVMKADYPYDDSKSLDKKTIGTAQGYLSTAPLQAYFGEDKVTLMTDDATGIQAVSNGQISAYFGGSAVAVRVGNNPSFQVHQLTTGDFNFPPERLGARTHLFVSCSNKELGKAINAVMDEMRASGELEAVVKANFPGPGSISAPDETPEDRCS